MPSAVAPEVTSTEAVALVRHWLKNAELEPADPAATQLADLLRDRSGLDFTVGFIDGVIRPEDPHIAAQNFRKLARSIPEFVPSHLRAAMRAGALASRVAPVTVIATVRKTMRSLVSHLVIDARPKQLGQAIGRIRADGNRLNLNLLG